MCGGDDPAYFSLRPSEFAPIKSAQSCFLYVLLDPPLSSLQILVIRKLPLHFDPSPCHFINCRHVGNNFNCFLSGNQFISSKLWSWFKLGTRMGYLRSLGLTGTEDFLWTSGIYRFYVHVVWRYTRLETMNDVHCCRVFKKYICIRDISIKREGAPLPPSSKFDFLF